MPEQWDTYAFALMLRAVHPKFYLVITANTRLMGYAMP
jgi:hypothetical protein